MKYYKVRFCDEGGDNVRGNAYIYKFDSELNEGDVVELPAYSPNRDNPHGVVIGVAKEEELNSKLIYREIVKKIK